MSRQVPMVAAMTTSGGRRIELTWEDLMTTRFRMSVKKRNSQAATLPTGDPMIPMNTISGAFAGAAALGLVGITPASAQQAPSHQSMPAMNMRQAISDSPAVMDFMEAKEKMHQAMNTPMTGDADRDFVDAMIPHHQGAIDMARVELKYGKDPKLKKLAQDIIAAQEREIRFMNGWREQHSQ
jgi:Domain of unknown function (DUF305)